MTKPGKTVILHAGLHKTGPARIQDLLLANRDTMPARIAVFNQVDGSSRALHKACQDFQIARQKGQTGDQARSDILKACRDMLDRSGDRSTILVSDEGIAGIMPGRLGHFRMYPQLDEIARILREGFAGHDVTFVLYLRDEPGWIESVYNQAVKQHRVRLDFDTFCKSFHDPIALAPVAERLVAVAGAERVKVINLADDQRDPFGLGGGLLRLAGLTPEELARLVPPRKRPNESLHPKALEIVRDLNATDIDPRNLQMVVQVLLNKAGLFADGERGRNWPFPPPPQAGLKIDRIFYINLDSRPDRRAHMEQLLEGSPAPVERMPGVMLAQDPEELGLTMIPQRKGQRGPAGIWLAHKAVLQRALETEGDGAILLLEDDLWLSETFWARDFTVPGPLPASWDILLLSPRLRTQKELDGHYFAPVALSRPVRLNALPFIASGAHFVIFRNRDAVRRVLANLDAAPITDVDLHYVAQLETYGVTVRSVTAGGFGSDH